MDDHKDKVHPVGSGTGAAAGAATGAVVGTAVGGPVVGTLVGAAVGAVAGGLVGHGVTEVRGRGLWAGVDIEPSLLTGRQACERLAAAGVLAKDTHGSTIRLAPPLVVTEDEVHYLVDRLAEVLAAAA